MTKDGPQDTAPEMTRAERIFVRISVVQTILAVTGFMVGVIALFAALNEADAVRKQQMASVWPHVTIRDVNYGPSGESRSEFIVGNRGIGPARIVSAEVTVDGRPIQTWRDVVAPLADGKEFSLNTYRISGSVLAPEEDLIAFGIDADYASAELVKAVQEFARTGRINIVICYCSVFDDCWRLDALAEETYPVEECGPPAPENRI